MEAILGGESWKGNNSVVVGTVGWHGPEVLHPLTERQEPPLRHPSIFFSCLYTLDIGDIH